MSWDDPGRYDADIERALATPGGHLSIGRGGFTLFYDNARLSEYDCDFIKGRAAAAGLPVIDSRGASFERVAILAVQGPMVAVNRVPDPRPWTALSQAPLPVCAEAYRRIGAEVLNLPAQPDLDLGFEKVPPGPTRDLYGAWTGRALRHGG